MCHRAPARAPLVALALAATLLGCTETDDTLEPVGVTRLTPVDPSLAVATLADPKMQFVRWDFARADLRIGEELVDLLGNDGCLVADGALFNPSYSGKCGGGVITGDTDGSVGTTLSLELTMAVRRAEPLVLQPQDDFDGDGIVNQDDTCPLEANPLQEDDDGNGIGDACQAVNIFTGEIELDSDDDLIVDSLDNCVAIKNTGQENTNDPLDGIGDACVEQDADVRIGGDTTLRLTLDPGTANLVAGLTLLAVVDFDYTATLNCDWAQGTCELDAAAVQACFSDSTSTAFTGCP